MLSLEPKKSSYKRTPRIKWVIFKSHYIELLFFVEGTFYMESIHTQKIMSFHIDFEFEELTDQETGIHHRSQSPSQSLSPSSLCPKVQLVCLKRKQVLLPAPGDRTGYHNKPAGIHSYGLSGQCGQRPRRIPSIGTGGYCSLCPRSPAMSTSKAP